MTKYQIARRNNVIRFMLSTAKQNGKDVDILDVTRVADRLHRLETTLNRLACDQCNYPVYDVAKQERLELLAVKIIKDEIGADAYTQRDPRGFMIRMYLVDENGRPWFNSWDGETVGLDW